ncbi:MAG: WXG100 family type VII secretion target [Stackebrandtia sp.]
MNVVTYNEAKILDAIDAVSGFQTAMRTEIEEIAEMVNTRIIPNFEGLSSQEFVTMQTNWNTHMDGVDEVLGRIAVALDDGSSRMFATDKKYAGLFSG